VSRRPTPMIAQYQAVKRRHPDKLVFFRLGDFYEVFFDDAELVARELDITLTARGASGSRVPMAGVPHHAAQGYIGRLLEKGYKVVLCDQVEDPRQARGLVRREVTRILTPGTVIDTDLLPDTANNFLCAVSEVAARLGLARVDISTGEFCVGEFEGPDRVDELLQEVGRLEPAECLLPASLAGDDGPAARIKALTPCVITIWPTEATDPAACRQALLEHFGTTSLHAFGCEDLPAAITAAASVLSYLRANQAGHLAHLRRLTTEGAGRFAALDRLTRRNLELFRRTADGSTRATLLWVLNRARTSMGSRRLRAWLEQPLRRVEDIVHRQQAVGALVDDPVGRAGLAEALKGLHDLERLCGRIGCGRATPRDLAALRDSLRRLPGLREAVGRFEAGLLRDLADDVDPCSDLERLLGGALVEDPPATSTEGGIIRDGYNEELDGLRRAARGGKDWIARLQTRERERTGIKSLKVGYNKVFGYYLEVTRPNLERVPDDYERKQTLTGSERYITPELKETEARVLGAEERAATLEAELFAGLRTTVMAETDRLLATARALAQIDALCALAIVALEQGYTRPRVHPSGHALRIVAGRHPVLEQVLGPGQFVANDCLLNDRRRVAIVTGPNMAGKSTYLRQVALCVLLAQVGGFVPAAEMEIGVVDRIFCRVGASDDLATGQSTFMAEMTEVAYILNHATEHSLLVLDEVGRGTSTFDGQSIAWAVTEFIARQVGARALVATHYHELTRLSESLPGTFNLTVAVEERGAAVVFLRRVVDGACDKSYGIYVARLAGVPESVVARAGEVLAALERGRPAAAADDDGGRTWGRRPAARDAAMYQPALFQAAPCDHPVLQELARLDIGRLTPLEALNRVHEWQGRLGAGDGGRRKD